MTTKYERKCKNWLVDFGKWTVPRSEAPESFIMWSGLFTLAAAIRRHIWIPKRYMGSYDVSPNLYVMFVAPPGKRKSTTITYATELLKDIPGITQSPERITKEALLHAMTKSPDGSVYITSSEFGEFIVKSGPDMYSFLTDAYDSKEKMDATTLSRGPETILKPCVNLLGATTPKWIADNMPESVIGGGFASRPVFIFEETVRTRQLYYDHLDHEKFDELKQNLFTDLAWIAQNLNGEVKLTSEQKEFTEDWYRKEARRVDEVDEKMQGFIERKPTLVHKVAMLVHIARSDTLELTMDDFTDAIRLLNAVEPKAAASFQAVGKNEYTADIKSILKFITQRGRVSERDLKAAFFHVALPEKLDQLILALEQGGFIRMGIDPNKPEGQRRLWIANTNGKAPGGTPKPAAPPPAAPVEPSP